MSLLVAAVVVACGGAAVVLRGGSNGALADGIAASYPEGPLSHGGRLFFAEMGADRVSTVAGGESRTFFSQRGCGPTAIAPYGADGFLVLCHLGRRVVSVSVAGRQVRNWVGDAAGNALMDPNDASADGRGGVYFSDPGVFSKTTTAHGRVMHLAADGVLRAVADGLWYPNGVYVDAASAQLYVSEHFAGRVLRFEIRPDATLGPPEVFATTADAGRPERYDTPYAETGPDGLEIGPDGDLYVVMYGDGRVLRFSRTGAYRGAIDLPTRYATNITFLADGRAVTTGSFSIQPPGRGEVRFHSADFTRGSSSAR